MGEIAKLLMGAGAVLLLLGILIQFIGKLPGDILIKKGNTTFYFPIVTCIIVSVILSLVFFVINRLK
ncbi:MULTISPECIES: DUF2905 domain-containing protein [Priestia]|uniref:Uncharacterized protein n=3 Tax=Priestia TaxID=2800373 RepID=A0A0H4KN12_9BACI|nr:MULTISPECIES: DUF2905 domain-containing protein [Priestia]AKO94261.1 hypothetical protein BEH_20480 [Priestia filamentosa]KYG36195.1 hypothetical protein AZF06_03080 [Priestia endophytica]MBG9815134.1 hypothetical protein [Priestia endophytica]MCM3539740.1 DUF2905 domain-containing protein [Priestia endophytica]MCY8233621.1 DUF2905 domain-containing protein [Priestia endophytica]